MQFTQDIWAITRVERTLKAGRSWIMKQAISFASCVKSVLMLWDCRENWTCLQLNIARDAFNHNAVFLSSRTIKYSLHTKIKNI